MKISKTINYKLILGCFAASIFLGIIILSLLVIIFYPSFPIIDIISFTPQNIEPKIDANSNLLTFWDLSLSIDNKNYFPLYSDIVRIKAFLDKNEVAYSKAINMSISSNVKKNYTFEVIVPIYKDITRINLISECMENGKLDLELKLKLKYFIFKSSAVILETKLQRNITCGSEILKKINSYKS